MHAQVQKAKKDKPELEEELEKAEREYEDVCDALDRKASVLEGSVGRDVTALGDLLDAEVGMGSYGTVLAVTTADVPAQTTQLSTPQSLRISSRNGPPQFEPRAFFRVSNPFTS